MKTSRYWTDPVYREAVKKKGRDRYANPVLGAKMRATARAWPKANRERSRRNMKQWRDRHGGSFKSMYPGLTRRQRNWAFSAYRWMIKKVKRESPGNETAFSSFPPNLT